MKGFMEGVLEWKTSAALMFSASVIVCAGIFLITGRTEIPILVLASMLIVTAVGTFLQFLAFSDRIIKKMRYTARMAVFAIPFFALLAVNAWCFHWFPVDETINWLGFTGIFLILFAGGIVSFELYFRAVGKKYDGLLGQYRKQKELEGK